MEDTAMNSTRGNKSSLVCALWQCSNSGYKLERWYKQECKKHKCRRSDMSKCSCSPPFTHFLFPREKIDPERRNEWIKVFEQSKKKGSHTGKTRKAIIDNRSTICSIHFEHNLPTIPTLHLDRPKERRRKPNEENLDKKNSKQTDTELQIMNNEIKVSQKCESSNDKEMHIKLESDGPMANAVLNKDECELCHMSDDSCNCAKLSNWISLFNESYPLDGPKSIDTFTTKSIEDLSIFVETDDKVKTYTGLRNKGQFTSIVHLIDNSVQSMRYWAQNESNESEFNSELSSLPKLGKRPLTVSEELLLVLMKLRLNLINELLGDIFGIATHSVTLLFAMWIPFIKRELDLIFWPPYEINNLMKFYENVKCIIDCLEIPIERPPTSQLQSVTWSKSKGNYTIKFVYAISPNRTCISFISDLWCGKVSDYILITECGILDQLKLGQSVVADRRFPIFEELAKKGVTFVVLPNQIKMRAEEKIESHSTNQRKKRKEEKQPWEPTIFSNACFYIEKNLRKLKEYKILTQTLPLEYVPLIEDIIFVCAVLCNIQGPL